MLSCLHLPHLNPEFLSQTSELSFLKAKQQTLVRMTTSDEWPDKHLFITGILLLCYRLNCRAAIAGKELIAVYHAEILPKKLTKAVSNAKHCDLSLKC